MASQNLKFALISQLCLFYLGFVHYLFGSFALAETSLVLHPNAVSSLSLRQLYKGTALLFTASDNGEIAYASGGKAGSFIISLKNPQVQEVIAQIPGTHVQYVDYKGNYLFVSDQFDGASIYNITEITKPVLIVSLKEHAPQVQASIVTSDIKYLYVLNNGNVLSFDITDISNPVLIKKTGVTAPYSYRLKFDVQEQFITVSNHLMGVQIMDIRNRSAPQLRGSKNPNFVTWDSMFTKDSKFVYAVDIYFGLYGADVTAMSAIDKDSTTLFTLNWELIFFQIDLETMCLYLTQDNSHLLLGFRSIGIYLFKVDTSNYKSITFVQHLQASYMTLSIAMPKNNESILLASNGVSLLLYSVVAPSLNQDFPNLQNSFQSTLTPKYLPIVVPSVYCMNDDKHIIAMNLLDKFTIYNTETGYKLTEVASVDRDSAGGQGYLCQATVSKDNKYLYVTSSQSGVLTYDITTLSTPTKVADFLPAPAPYNQVLTLRFDPTESISVAANSFFGVFYLMAISPTQLAAVSYFAVPQACGFQECLLLSDKIRIICSCREVGVFFFQLEQIGQPLKLLSIFQEIGSEAATLSADEKTLFAGLGFQGIFIIDVSDFTKPTEISRLILKGWVQFLATLFNEKYLVVSQLDKGQIALVNIEDLSNPYVHQLAEFQNEDSSSLCIPPSGSSMFFIGNKGLRNLKIVTDLKIHTQIQVEVRDSDGNFKYYNTLTPSEPLMVGQVAYFTFVPLYTQKNVKIESIKYYRYFEKQTLPSWMTYLPAKRQIYMTVDKTAVLNEFSTELNGENILILEIVIEITASDFVLTGLITPALSSHLFSVLQTLGYIDYYGSLTDLLDSNKELTFDFFDATFTSGSFTASELAQIYSHVKKILVFSKYDYLIRFFVQNSLIFNLSPSSSRMLNEGKSKKLPYTKKNPRILANSVLSTPSKQITVFMQILANGVFVKKTFEGVLASFADDLSSVRISGQTAYVDTILSKSIQVSNSTANLEEVTMTVLIQDSNNYDLEISTNLAELEFASFHKPVLVNEEKSLRSQLEHTYPNADLPVEQRFQFSFDTQSFTQADNLAITYKAYIINSDGSETEIQTGLWIEFNSQSLGFSGQRTVGYFRDSTTIKIVASDFYSSTSSTFDLNFWTVPFFYIIQVGVSIIGPLLGVLGLWKYRHEIHLFVAERKNMYQDEVAIMGQVYKKQIVLFSTIQSDGERLMKLYLKENVNFLEELNQQYITFKSVNMPLIMSLLEKFYQPIQEQFPNIDPREFDFDDSRLVRVIKRVLYLSLLESDEKTKQAFEELKKFALKRTNHYKDWYKRYIKINPIIKIVDNQVIRKRSTNNTPAAAAEILNQQQNSQQQFLIEESKDIKVKNVNSITNSKNLIDMPEVVLSQRMTEQYKVTPNSPTVIVPSSFRQQSGTFGNNANENNNNIEESQYLNPVGQENNNNNNNQKDKIDEELNELEKDQFTDLNPFPEMVIMQQAIQETLRSADFHDNYDFHLLAESIALEASGLLVSLPSGLNPAVGESIHVSAHDLFTVQAFRRNKGGFVSKVLEFMNMDYTPIGLVRNNPLPKWLNYQIVDGIVNLWGKPTLSDETEILIRIINNTLITVHSFRILIQDKERHDIRDKNLLRKVTQKIGVNVKRNKQHSMVHSSVNMFADQERPTQQQMMHHMQNSEVLISADQLNLYMQKQVSKEEIDQKLPNHETNITPRGHHDLKISTKIGKAKIEEIPEHFEESPVQPQLPRELRYVNNDQEKNAGELGIDDALKDDSVVVSIDSNDENQNVQKPPVKTIKSQRDCQ